MKNLDAAATAFLRQKGYNSAGQPLKKAVSIKPSEKKVPWVRIISVPMGGMTRRPWR